MTVFKTNLIFISVKWQNTILALLSESSTSISCFETPNNLLVYEQFVRVHYILLLGS